MQSALRIVDSLLAVRHADDIQAVREAAKQFQGRMAHGRSAPLAAELPQVVVGGARESATVFMRDLHFSLLATVEAIFN